MHCTSEIVTHTSRAPESGQCTTVSLPLKNGETKTPGRVSPGASRPRSRTSQGQEPYTAPIFAEAQLASMTLNFLGACLHAFECGGYYRTEAVRGTPDARAAPPARARALSALSAQPLSTRGCGHVCSGIGRE